MTTLHLRESTGPSPLRLAFFLIPLLLFCLGLSPAARAVDPPPDGGYPGFNTAEGHDALFSLTAGRNNTAIGFDALFSLTTGRNNTAIGFDALFSNTTGNRNTASGYQALFSNTTSTSEAGSDNTASGWQALFSNTGLQNTAVGSGALFSNTIWGFNTAVGSGALYYNDSPANTAIGALALNNNRTGATNTAVGEEALYFNTAGITNTAIGWAALYGNTGNNNLALGGEAGEFLTAGSDNIDLANCGIAGESATIRIGTSGTQTNTFIAGISGATVPAGVGVIIDTTGHLGTIVSSERFKDSIKPMEKASEAILSLKPVTFRYKKELDPKAIPQFGLVAEEVAKVNPDLVARDSEGKPYTVRYEAVNAMLLNEFLKARRQIDAQQKQIDALTAGLQKVSAQFEASKPAPEVVNNR